MMFTELRNELSDFYKNKLPEAHAECEARCLAALNEAMPQNIPAIEMKARQYGILAETLTPVLFRSTRFFSELCINNAAESVDTPGAWTYRKMGEEYRRLGAEVLNEKRACTEYPLYSFCGEFGDEQYHFAFENRKILSVGFRGIYERTIEAMARLSDSDPRRSWYAAVSDGLLSVKRLAERFSELARSRAEIAGDEEERSHFLSIAETAQRIPWEPPKTFYEALETIVFIQEAIPALEGGGLYTAGRLDVLLKSFYDDDIKKGRITEDEAYRLICEFLLRYDLRIPHDRKGQSDSLVNVTYTLGGIDEDGNHVFNELTELFLKADREEEIIYPKLKCRYDAASPKAYLDLINETLMNGKSTMNYFNDDALIPAFRRAGISAKDAADYSVLGCWEIVIPGCSNEHCSYFSLIGILELSVHGGLSRKELPFSIRPLDDAKSFEEVVDITLANIHAVMDSRSRVVVTARKHWSEIDPHPLLSSTLDNCLASGRDVTAGGAKYNFDEIICAGLPNLIDSLLAIRDLCFEKKRYSLPEFLETVRNNWDNESVRRDALSCHFWGDESDESCALAKRLTDDIEAYAETLPALWGGRVTVGYMLFMEMYRWAKKLRATPDGRRDYDYFARGFTPSTLHKIDAVTSVINCCRHIDPTGIAADSVVTLTIPYTKIPLSVWEALVRQMASTGVGAWQINCVSREELIDAKVHPERHQSLVVRVCGYSANFTSLPEYVQDEVIARNTFR